MNATDLTRRLSAILSADVEGYSRLMRDDEEATVQTITTYRTAMTHLINQYRGRVVDSPGDNILAEFTSVVDAVNCGVEIQRELAERNAELPENRRMQFRIGINLGDVLQERARIYGDGVNIAARMESLAEAGGISISGTVYDAIENKIGLEYEYLGEQEVKNIDKPVRAYRVLSYPGAAAHRVVKAKRAVGRTWRNTMITIAAVLVVTAASAVWYFYLRPPPIEPASVEKMAFPLPEKPSIAVLPFVNMSGDPKQEYIADGITENITTALSKIPEMFVIARTSTMTYKGKPVKIKQVSEELGVRYVLEGSVQKEGQRVRITAQLVDAVKGHHLWAESYDRDMKGFFDLLDEMAKKIGAALQVKLTWGDYARYMASTDNFKAWGYFNKGSSLFQHYTREDNAKAREYFQKALKLDPEYLRALLLIAWTHLFDSIYGWSKSPRQSMELAEELAQKASTMNESDPGVPTIRCQIYQLKEQYDKSIAEGERAIALDPNFAIGYLILAHSLNVSGRFEEAIAKLKTAIRLNGPYYPPQYLRWLGGFYCMAGRYEEAISEYKNLLDRCRKGEYPPIFAHTGLTRAYMMAGQEEKARAHAAEVLKIDPNYSLEKLRKMLRYKDPAHNERIIDALRKAGLPDKLPVAVSEKPSIAVLPFANIRGDPKEDYLSDGITENIITALSKTPKMLVIARNSVFTYKGKPVMVQQVSEELGVRYVLEGSVQKEGNRLRITAQLIDAKTGNHLWSERYDRELKDLFAVQDEITMRVIEGLRVELTEGDQGRIYSRGTDNLEAYLKVLRGLDLVLRLRSKDDNALGRQMYEEAIALDPGYSNAYAVLAWTHNHDVVFGWTKTPKKSLNLMLENAQKAVSLDESNPNAHSVLETTYRFMRMLDKALAAGKQAIALAPNGADTNAIHSFTLLVLGRNEEALATINKAIDLNPIPPNWYLLAHGLAYQNTGQYEEAITAYKKALLINPKYLLVLYRLGTVYRMVGQYDEAIAALKKVIHLNPNFLWAHIDLAASYSLTGQEEKAHAEAKEALRISPKFSVDRWAKTGPGGLKSFRRDQKDIYITALRKAGLK